jgi:hypothetical protein
MTITKPFALIVITDLLQIKNFMRESEKKGLKQPVKNTER